MPEKAKIITVTGGKGGTGKTLVAVNLATMFKNAGKRVLLIDGDVENPNTYLLMNGELENKAPVYFFKPSIIETKCSKCGLCSKNCATHALLHVDGQYPIPFLTVCSGCKLCYKICPEEAIKEDYKTIGWTYETKKNNMDLWIGELKPSEARSAAVVEALLDNLKELLEKEPQKYDIIVLDTAPGAHCDVELLLESADLIVPVTEPTKFGKLDLLRIIELIELLGKPYKAIINRSSLLGFKEKFLEELERKDIEILGDIPLDDEIVQSYCQGDPLMDENSNFNKEGEGYKSFITIFENLNKWIREKKTASMEGA
ncbi:MAG: AAA family ATPase [Candidatus Lokiarchaeota archaeon]|nr:AAA family ATPase [Candidatus Lokiarchaeota archaeon]MBD3202036.1 AAA family ATPase [Candidatus Lokiarchaeota archaeon]